MWSSNFLHAGLSGKILKCDFISHQLPLPVIISVQHYHYTVQPFRPAVYLYIQLFKPTHLVSCSVCIVYILNFSDSKMMNILGLHQNSCLPSSCNHQTSLNCTCPYLAQQTNFVMIPLYSHMLKCEPWHFQKPKIPKQIFKKKRSLPTGLHPFGLRSSGLEGHLDYWYIRTSLLQCYNTPIPEAVPLNTPLQCCNIGHTMSW